MMNALRSVAIVTAAVALVAVAYHNTFALDLVFFALIFATLGQSWNWVSGYAGQVSFGHAIFFGCGAYASAIFVLHHLSPWPAIGVGMIAAGLIALVIGFPCFKLRGHYFSIATIAIGAIIETYAKSAAWLGSANGFEMPLLPPGLANLQFINKTPYVLLALSLFVVAQLITIWIEHSRMGYYLRAIRANQQAAASVGIDARYWKLAAFVMSAAIAAAAGSLQAQHTLFVEPESVLSLPISISIALVGVVGGVATLWGPAVGAVIYVFLAKFVAVKFGGSGNGLDLMLYGGLIVIIAAWRPSGVVGFFKRRPKPRPLEPEGAAT